MVLSLTGNVGRVGIVAESNCLLNQRVAVIKPNSAETYAALYFLLRSRGLKERMIGIAKGTAQANLSPVETAKLTVPFDEVAFAKFCIQSQPLFDTLLANMQESRKLAQLRDALLPKLMSGEIDVSKVDLTQLNSHLSDHSVAIREINNSTIADATFINRFIALRMLFEKLSHGIRHAFDIRG